MSDDITVVGANSVTTGDGWTIQSNSDSAEDIQQGLEALKPPEKAESEKEPDASTAASVLGKRGGEASAAARKIKPIPPRRTAGAETAGVADRGVEEPVGQAESAEQVEPDEKPLGKPRDDPRARMLEATRKEAEAKRERDYYRAEYERLRAEHEAGRRAGGQQEPHPSVQPEAQREKPPFKPEDFPEYEDYLDARDSWREQRWMERQQEEAAVQQYAAQIDAAVGSYQERLRAALPTLEDYQAKISEEVRELTPSFLVPAGQAGPLNVVADELLKSEMSADLMIYLSEHPENLQRLATLPSVQAVQREMAKLEARIEAASAGTPAPTPAPISKARPPVRPVTSSPPVDTDEVTDDMPYDEHVRVMNARERRARR